MISLQSKRPRRSFLGPRTPSVRTLPARPTSWLIHRPAPPPNQLAPADRPAQRAPARRPTRPPGLAPPSPAPTRAHLRPGFHNGRRYLRQQDSSDLPILSKSSCVRRPAGDPAAADTRPSHTHRSPRPRRSPIFYNAICAPRAYRFRDFLIFSAATPCFAAPDRILVRKRFLTPFRAGANSGEWRDVRGLTRETDDVEYRDESSGSVRRREPGQP